jgi:hypothetical protein
MDKKETFALYEKLYFHEIDSREKLNSRLQMPLALIVSFIGALAFMLQNFECEKFSGLSIIFLILLAGSTLCLVRAIWFFIRSWYGNTYSFLPSAKDTEQYHSTLVEMYKQYARGDQLAKSHFEDYIRRYYIDCSSANTECNDRRSVYVHKTNSALIATAVVAFLAFFTFYLGNFDKSRVKKPTEVTIVTPVEIIGDKMSEKKTPEPVKGANPPDPPPPPPPPPPRQIREGVEVVKPTLSNTGKKP